MDFYRICYLLTLKCRFLNGVEFSKIIAKRYKHIKILILTAYSDFNYARECIEISNVIGYLLKPIDKEEIKNYLRTVKFEQVPEVSVDFSDEDTDLHVRIRKYIEENYANTYLNVGAIAEQFGYNASYISSYYKKETGISLSDEIFRYRMEQAVRYKKSGLKMYLVAQKVGIADPYYFSKCFKKYTGSSFKTYEVK